MARTAAESVELPMVKTIIRDVSAAGDQVSGAEFAWQMDEYVAGFLANGYELRYVACLGRHQDASMAAPAFTWVFTLVKPSAA